MNNQCKSGWHMLWAVLLIIGGLNWGLVGLGMIFGNTVDSWNVVHLIFAGWAPIIEAIIYLLVGVAAVAKIFSRGSCKAHKAVTSASTEQPKEGGAGQAQM